MDKNLTLINQPQNNEIVIEGNSLDQHGYETKFAAALRQATTKAAMIEREFSFKLKVKYMHSYTNLIDDGKDYVDYLKIVYSFTEE